MVRHWKIPAHWEKVLTIDAHTAGEPLRILVEGVPKLPGKTILAKRRYAQDHLDHLRKALMWEPRGHADMYGAILTDPVTPDGHLGVLFIHNLGFSTMCGHGIIGLATVAVETEMVPIKDPTPVLRFDTPAGRVTAEVHMEESKVTHVSFHNVPSFVLAMDQEISVPGLGVIRYDIAYGGAFYAFCDASQLGFELVPGEFSRLVEAGKRIKQEVLAKKPILHPFEDDLGFLYGVIFVGPPHDTRHHSRNVCIFADGELDRSPTGTGLSARAALHFARQELKIGQPFRVESILGTCFTGRVIESLPFGLYEAVAPEVSGSAHIVGRCEWVIDPDDPLRHGFFLR